MGGPCHAQGERDGAGISPQYRQRDWGPCLLRQQRVERKVHLCTPICLHYVCHTVAFPLRENTLALMVLTRATSGPVVVDGESFLDALFASAGQG